MLGYYDYSVEPVVGAVGFVEVVGVAGNCCYVGDCLRIGIRRFDFDLNCCRDFVHVAANCWLRFDGFVVDFVEVAD